MVRGLAHPSHQSAFSHFPQRRTSLHLRIYSRTAKGRQLDSRKHRMSFVRTLRNTYTPTFQAASAHYKRQFSSSTTMPDKITGWASGDGSFKRQVSSFRDHIEEGGKFAPEKGEWARRFAVQTRCIARACGCTRGCCYAPRYRWYMRDAADTQADTTSTSPSPARGPTEPSSFGA